VTARAAELPFRDSHTRNFEVDHVSDKRLVTAGALMRIGVAVIVDGVAHMEAGKRLVVPRERAELDTFAALVRSAVGASAARGDSVTVESVPFDQTPTAVEPELHEASPVAGAPARSLRAYAPAAGAALVLLTLASIAVARRRAAAKREAATAAALPQIVAAPRLDAAETAQDLRARALERAAQDPATAALVLRLWLGTSEAEIKS